MTKPDLANAPDWTGASLMSAKPTAAERRSRHAAAAQLIGKLRGYTVPPDAVRRHSAFVVSALGGHPKRKANPAPAEATQAESAA